MSSGAVPIGVFFKKFILSQQLIRIRNMADAVAHQGDKRKFQVYYELLSLLTYRLNSDVAVWAKKVMRVMRSIPMQS